MTGCRVLRKRFLMCISLTDPLRPMIYTIKLSLPTGSAGEVVSWLSDIRASKKVLTIYDIVDRFEKKIFPKLDQRTEPIEVKRKTELKNVLNIHNDDGIRDIHQIKQLADALKSGKHILPRGLPNIKLVKTMEGRLLLFDGHHSMLAYISTGKTHLEEIPHLMITGKEKGYIEDNDIIVFYGEHASDIEGCNWRDNVINWQATKDKRLCKRVQNNMGELFSAIDKRVKLI